MAFLEPRLALKAQELGVQVGAFHLDGGPCSRDEHGFPPCTSIHRLIRGECCLRPSSCPRRPGTTLLPHSIPKPSGKMYRLSRNGAHLTSRPNRKQISHSNYRASNERGHYVTRLPRLPQNTKTFPKDGLSWRTASTFAARPGNPHRLCGAPHSGVMQSCRLYAVGRQYMGR